MNGRFLILFLLVFQFAWGQPNADSTFRLVANKIIQQSKQELIPDSMPNKQQYMLLMSAPPKDGVTNHIFKTSIVFDKDVAKQKLRLAVTCSKGDVKLLWNGKLLYSASKKNNGKIVLLDYELIGHEFLRAISVNDTNTLLIIANNAKQPYFYIDFILPNKMQAKNWHCLPAKKEFLYAAAKKYDHTTQFTTLPFRQWWKSTASLDYTDWKYFTGTYLYALQQEDSVYNWLAQNFYNTFHTTHKKIKTQRDSIGYLDGLYWNYFRGTMLDDWGPQAAALLRLLQHKHKKNIEHIKKDEWFGYINEALLFFSTKLQRLPDNTFARLTPVPGTVQSDDLWMGNVFLVTAYGVLQEQRYLDEAYQQCINFYKYLYHSKTGLYKHAYFSEVQSQSNSSWSRGLGWALLANQIVLQHTNHPLYDSLLHIQQQLLKNCVQYIREDGLLHQVINNKNTYPETSGTAMLLYCFSAMMYNNNLPRSYKRVCDLLWKGLSSQIDEQGNVKNIVRGTPILENDEAYNNQQVRTNDPRGIGAVLMACKMYSKIQN